MKRLFPRCNSMIYHRLPAPGELGELDLYATHIRAHMRAHARGIEDALIPLTPRCGIRPCVCCRLRRGVSESRNSPRGSGSSSSWASAVYLRDFVRCLTLPADIAEALLMNSILRPCAQPGCRELVERGRCSKHSLDRFRGNSSERGYDAAWQRFRSWFVSRHPLCADCEEVGQVNATEEVHHIRKLAEFPELRLVESNCMGLCKSCHSVRTRRGE